MKLTAKRTIPQPNHLTPLAGQSARARLLLVDLAGSELARKTGAQGATLKEAGSINKSLSALGNVIRALTSNRAHVPYRDSKLTRLLEDSLGGNSRTSIVVTVSPATIHREETESTLRFGARAKCVTNAITVEVMRSAAEYKAMVEKLTKRL